MYALFPQILDDHSMKMQDIIDEEVNLTDLRCLATTEQEFEKCHRPSIQQEIVRWFDLDHVEDRRRNIPVHVEDFY